MLKSKKILLSLICVLFSFSANFAFAAKEYDLNSVNWSVFHTDIKTQFEDCLENNVNYPAQCIAIAPTFLDSIASAEERNELEKICDLGKGAYIDMDTCRTNISQLKKDSAYYSEIASGNLRNNSINWNIIGGDIAELEHCLTEYNENEICYLEYVDTCNTETDNEDKIKELIKVCNLLPSGNHSICLSKIRNTAGNNYCENGDAMCIGHYAFGKQNAEVSNAKAYELGQKISAIEKSNLFNGEVSKCVDPEYFKPALFIYSSEQIDDCLYQSIDKIIATINGGNKLNKEQWNNIVYICNLFIHKDNCYEQISKVIDNDINICQLDDNPSLCFGVHLAKLKYYQRKSACEQIADPSFKTTCIKQIEQPRPETTGDKPEAFYINLFLVILYLIVYGIFFLKKSWINTRLNIFWSLIKVFILIGLISRSFFLLITAVSTHSSGSFLPRLLFSFTYVIQDILNEFISSLSILYILGDLWPIYTIAIPLALLIKSKKTAIITGIIFYALTQIIIFGLMFSYAVAIGVS